jgi:YHS domain-containing protein
LFLQKTTRARDAVPFGKIEAKLPVSAGGILNMNRIFSSLPGARGSILVPAVLGVCTMLLNPGVEACGPVMGTIHCPVAGLGKGMQPDGCPGGYCGRRVTLKGPSLDYKGAKLYFCCSGCPKEFQKSPAKFAANANHQLVATFQAKQTSCPLCGGELKNPVVSMIGDVPVRLCSKGCQDKVNALKPAEQLQTVFGDAAFAKAFVIKTKTPAPAATMAAPAPSATSCDAGTDSGCCCCQPQAATDRRK